MRSSHVWIVLVTVSTMLIAGCGILDDDTTTEESVLEGQWQAIVLDEESDQLEQTYLTFDSQGALITLQTVIGGVAVTRNEEDLISQINVEGSQVFIQVGFDDVSNLSFVGTLNEAQTVVNGRVTVNFSDFNATVTVNNAEAAFNKQ